MDIRYVPDKISIGSIWRFLKNLFYKIIYYQGSWAEAKQTSEGSGDKPIA